MDEPFGGPSVSPVYHRHLERCCTTETCVGQKRESGHDHRGQTRSWHTPEGQLTLKAFLQIAGAKSLEQ